MNTDGQRWEESEADLDSTANEDQEKSPDDAKKAFNLKTAMMKSTLEDEGSSTPERSSGESSQEFDVEKYNSSPLKRMRGNEMFAALKDSIEILDSSQDSMDSDPVKVQKRKRGRPKKNKEAKVVDDSEKVESSKKYSQENQESEKKSAKVSKKKKKSETDSDDDLPLNQLSQKEEEKARSHKGKNDRESVDKDAEESSPINILKSPLGSKSDAEDDTSLCLLLSNSSGPSLSKPDSEASKPKEKKKKKRGKDRIKDKVEDDKEEDSEVMEVDEEKESSLVPESCQDIFADSEPVRNAEKNKTKENKRDSDDEDCQPLSELQGKQSPDSQGKQSPSPQLSRAEREARRLAIDMKSPFDKKRGRLAKGKMKRGRLSLDPMKRKRSPATSPLGGMAKKLKRLSASPRVAITPLSKANRALVAQQLKIAARTSKKEAKGEAAESVESVEEPKEESPKVEVVEMKSEEMFSEVQEVDKVNDREETIGEFVKEETEAESAGSNVEEKESKAKSEECDMIPDSQGTLHNLMKGVSASPPKKGKPCAPQETPTSGSKFSSRSAYILEKSRKICLSKASPAPLSGRRLLPARKPTPGKSILKNSPNNSSPQKPAPFQSYRGSPQPSKPVLHSDSPPSFRPIQIPKIYSPSASPSAGILKRRRLSGDTANDSPSPPNKVRTKFSRRIQEVLNAI